jgi:hypothetical protein
VVVAARVALRLDVALMRSFAFRCEIVRCICRNGQPIERVSVVVDGRNAASLNTLPNQGSLFRSLRLLADVCVGARIVSRKDRGSSLAAKIAVEALVGNVKLAGDVLWRSVLELIAWHMVGFRYSQRAQKCLTSRIRRRRAGSVDDTTDAIRAVACICFVRPWLVDLPLMGLSEWVARKSGGSQKRCLEFFPGIFSG